MKLSKMYLLISFTTLFSLSVSSACVDGNRTRQGTNEILSESVCVDASDIPPFLPDRGECIDNNRKEQGTENVLVGTCIPILSLYPEICNGQAKPIQGIQQLCPLVKKTGQLKSYDQVGNEITNGSVKDDGYYQNGLTPKYDRNVSNEVVTDNLTNLKWLDDQSVHTVKKQWLTDYNYNQCYDESNSSACYDTSGDTAITYCENLTSSNYSWRLPTRAELRNITEYAQDGSIINSMFINFSISNNYWSSTTSAHSIDNAWRISFSWAGGQGTSDKDRDNFISCVSGEKDVETSYSRNNIDDIVTDNNTHLQWQDNSDAKDLSKIWIDAINYCEALTLGNHDDWRLPNVNELVSIADDTKSIPAINNIFQNVELNGYWSSTTDKHEINGGLKAAWVVEFNYTNPQSSYLKYQYMSLRCVRTQSEK